MTLSCLIYAAVFITSTASDKSENHLPQKVTLWQEPCNTSDFSNWNIVAPSPVEQAYGSSQSWDCAFDDTCWIICEGSMYRTYSTIGYQDISFTFDMDQYCSLQYSIDNDITVWKQFDTVTNIGDDKHIINKTIFLNESTWNNPGVSIRIAVVADKDDDCCLPSRLYFSGVQITASPTTFPTFQPNNTIDYRLEIVINLDNITAEYVIDTIQNNIQSNNDLSISNVQLVTYTIKLNDNIIVLDIIVTNDENIALNIDVIYKKLENVYGTKVNVNIIQDVPSTTEYIAIESTDLLYIVVGSAAIMCCVVGAVLLICCMREKKNAPQIDMTVITAGAINAVASDPINVIVPDLLVDIACKTGCPGNVQIMDDDDIIIDINKFDKYDEGIVVTAGNTNDMIDIYATEKHIDLNEIYCRSPHSDSDSDICTSSNAMSTDGGVDDENDNTHQYTGKEEVDGIDIKVSKPNLKNGEFSITYTGTGNMNNFSIDASYDVM